MKTLHYAALATQLVALAAAGPARAQTLPCQTNADTAASHVASVTVDVTKGDSTRLVQQGLPYKPAGGVAIVTDTIVCQSIINAFNARFSNPSAPGRITRAYVMSVGTGAYAMVGEKTPAIHIYFDTTYTWLAALVGI